MRTLTMTHPYSYIVIGLTGVSLTVVLGRPGRYTVGIATLEFDGFWFVLVCSPCCLHILSLTGTIQPNMTRGSNATNEQSNFEPTG